MVVGKGGQIEKEPNCFRQQTTLLAQRCYRNYYKERIKESVMSQSFILWTPEQLEQFSKNLLDRYASQQHPISEQARLEVLTEEELSQRLKISVSTLARYRKKKKIPFLTVGDCIRYDLAAVIKALS
jgi:adenylate kinase family enzyme